LKVSLVCKICEKEYRNYISLGTHIYRKHNLSSKNYYDIFYKKKNDGFCKCGNETKFYRLSYGYFNYCCRKCSGKSSKVRSRYKSTIVKRFGVDSPMKSNIVKEKRNQTCLKRYGVENPAQTEKELSRMRNGGAVKALKGNKNPSWPQTQTYENAKELYPEAILNYTLRIRKNKWYSLDTAILSLKIDIEYDGKQWHKDQEKDRKRDSEVKCLGWKVLRYRDRVPTKEQLRKDILEVLSRGSLSKEVYDG
jgi:hypothetical protein